MTYGPRLLAAVRYPGGAADPGSLPRGAARRLQPADGGRPGGVPRRAGPAPGHHRRRRTGDVQHGLVALLPRYVTAEYRTSRYMIMCTAAWTLFNAK